MARIHRTGERTCDYCGHIESAHQAVSGDESDNGATVCVDCQTDTGEYAPDPGADADDEPRAYHTFTTEAPHAHP